MARNGMTQLIRRLRGLTNAGTADYTISDYQGGETYWSPDHLQEILDENRTDLARVLLEPVPEYTSGGNDVYKDYYIGYGNIEGTASGTVAWDLEDSTGASVASNLYTLDAVRGVVRFTADQDGTAYYARARTYDLNMAAADVWRRKAAHYAEAYDFGADDQRFSRSQLIKNAMMMASQYEREAGIQVSVLHRSDLT